MSYDELRPAWCSGCGYEYPDPAGVAAMPGSERAGCPQCGSIAVNFAMEFQATVSTSAAFTAYKPPGASGESVRHDRGAADPRVADADLEPSGELRDRIEGRASTKGASELRAARILVEYLNSLGARWAPAELHRGGREEEGVDAVAADGDQTLEVQVTTPEHSAWSTLAQQSELVRGEPDVEAALESIKTAIERKTLFAGREEIVLALDATDSLRYALKGVADAFRAKYGPWAVGAGYQSIWLVGPLADLVQRLDTEA